MRSDGDMPRFSPRDVTTALVLLTRLPVPVGADGTGRRGGRAAWAYPLAGAVVGALAASVAMLALWLGLGLAGAAGLALATQIVVTGAMHEDGLADCADGFWGGWDRDRRLEIMRDSRIGTYGVLALALGVLLRWVGLLSVLATAPLLLVPVAMASRAAMVAPMALLDHARADGLAHSVGRSDVMSLAVALLVATIGILVTAPAMLLPILVAALVAAVFCGAIARQKIGGQTGDVLGATQQLAEIAILLTLAATLG